MSHSIGSEVGKGVPLVRQDVCECDQPAVGVAEFSQPYSGVDLIDEMAFRPLCHISYSFWEPGINAAFLPSWSNCFGSR